MVTSVSEKYSALIFTIEFTVTNQYKAAKTHTDSCSRRWDFILYFSGYNRALWSSAYNYLHFQDRSSSMIPQMHNIYNFHGCVKSPVPWTWNQYFSPKRCCSFPWPHAILMLVELVVQQRKCKTGEWLTSAMSTIVAQISKMYRPCISPMLRSAQTNRPCSSGAWNLINGTPDILLQIYPSMSDSLPQNISCQGRMTSHCLSFSTFYYLHTLQVTPTKTSCKM